MKFGYCTNVNFMRGDEESCRIFDAIVDSGFDYIETHISHIAEFDKAMYESFKKELAAKNVAVEVGLMLFPMDMPLVTDAMDINQIKSHADKVLGVAADLGTKVIIFGNGNTRAVPDGMDYATAYERMRQIISAVDPIAGKHGVKIAIEPLNAKETNMINSVQEAVDLVNSVSAVNVGTACDWYHTKTDNRTLDDVIANADKIFHLHIAHPETRGLPSTSDNMSDYAEFAKMAKQIGYDDKLSIEAYTGDINPETIKNALAVLKNLFN